MLDRITNGSVWTNISYLVAAITALQLPQWFFAGPLFLSLTLLAVGSFFFHYYDEKRYFWQRMDVYGMYCSFSFLTAYLLFLLIGYGFVLSMAGFVASAVLCWFKEKLSSFWVLGINFIILIVIKILLSSWIIGLSITSIFASSYFIRHLGEKNHELHQPFHGLWHIGTSAGIIMLLY